MKPLRLIFFRPKNAFALIRLRPRWQGAFCLLAGCAIILGYLQHAGVTRELLRHLPPSATEGDRDAVLQYLDTRLTIGLLFLPVRLSVGWASFALLMLALTRGFRARDPLRYAHTMALEVHAEAVLMAGSLVAMAILQGGDNSGVVLLPWGLDYFLPQGAHILWRIGANAINPFSYWYLNLLILGLRELGGYTTPKAGLIAVSSWIAGIFSNIAMLAALERILGLQM